MEAVLIGAVLLSIGAYLKYTPTRAEVWNYIAAWALSNRDAARLRTQRRKQYMLCGQYLERLESE